ncbi:sugar transferase [Desertimonas flava]|uniref:sugar transferase n=1 Tax=Desertimonas flava TaxID=2064846 RepID=UPI0013C4FCD8|nr:sugar transferase [Desertimonas flava]
MNERTAVALSSAPNSRFESLTSLESLQSEEFAVHRTIAVEPLSGLLRPVAVPPTSAQGFDPARISDRYDRRGRQAKRAFDVVAAALLIVVLSPLLVILAIGVVVSSPGNPLFGQERVGHGGRHFRCLKFRTMYRDSEHRLRADPDLHARYVGNDYKLLLHEDPRVFGFGRLLRRTSLDELPQLFNVLVGSMSLVGPRPVVPDELGLYGPWRGAYLEAVPGITGPWQVNGRNDIRYPERAMLDAEYVEGWTFQADLMILLRTIPSVLKRRGCH